MNTSNSNHDWYQSMSQIGFKHMEYFSVFHNKAFEWQTYFYKAQLNTAERVGELSRKTSSNGHQPLTIKDMYFGFHAFYQKELIALYQSHPYKQTCQDLKNVLTVMSALQKEYLENLLLPPPLKMILHCKYPYFSPVKKENSLSQEPKVKVNPVKMEDSTKSQVPENKKRKE